MALITPDQFRQHYPGLTGTSEDVLLASIITRVDDLLAAECGYPQYDSGGGAHSLEDQTYTLHLDAPSPLHRDALCLCVRPIVSVTSVHVDATRAYGASTELTEGTDFSVESEDGLLIRAYGETWPSAWRAMKVVVVAGYATTPPGLVAIAAAATRHLWTLRNTQGESAYGVLGDSATLTDTDALLPAAVRAALAPYRVCR